MRTALTTLGGVLVGPFAGYFATYWLSYMHRHNDCMWRFGAHFGGLFIGAPVGLVTFGVIGFCVGYLLDKRTNWRRISEESPHRG
jgi:MFS family permease